jgi:hypothetical protein
MPSRDVLSGWFRISNGVFDRVQLSDSRTDFTNTMYSHASNRIHMVKSQIELYDETMLCRFLLPRFDDRDGMFNRFILSSWFYKTE